MDDAMSETIKINNEILEYNKIIYVDAENGDDNNGDGSKNNPFKTFNKAYQFITGSNNLIINTSKAINFKSKLGSGQVFKEPINFKAYKTITNIRVM